MYRVMELKIEESMLTEASEEKDQYAQECKEVFLMGKRVNSHFEDHDFRKDAKLGLVYTNEEVMKKQRGVLGHFIKKMGQNWLSSKPLT